MTTQGDSNITVNYIYSLLNYMIKITFNGTKKEAGNPNSNYRKLGKKLRTSYKVLNYFPI